MTKFYLIVKRFLPVLFLASCCTMAFAQGRTVSGKVTSADDGSGVPGVNILEKGTSNGTVSDSEGNYKISVGDNATLVFSFVGYTTQEVAVGAQSTVNVSMQSDVQALEEVIVIGYGQVEAKDKTGALATLKAEDFNAGVISSPEQLMQGRIAGVQITSNSGEPGAAQTIRIRGTSSVISSNQPLYVIDGVPLAADDPNFQGFNNGGMGQSAARNPLNFMNPNDIERIDVLKDASATAIYGSRGANGVILISTKKGRSGKTIVEYGYQASLSSISKKYDLMTKDEFVAAYDKYNGAGAAANSVDKWNASTDWQNEVLRSSAFSQQHTLSFGGGDKGGDYRFSGSYLNQDGIVKNSSLERFTMRFNGTKKLMDDKLTIGTQFTVASTRDGNVPITTNSGFEGDLIGNMLKAAPSFPVYAPVNDRYGNPVPESPYIPGSNGIPTSPAGLFSDPSRIFQYSNTEPSPVAMLNLTKSYTNTMKAIGNISAEYEFIPGLKFKTVYGFDKSIANRKSAFSPALNASSIYGIGRLYLNTIEADNKLWENYLTYNHKFGAVTFDGLLGYSYQSFGYATQAFEFTNFRTTSLDEMINNYASADQAKTSVVGTNSSNTTDELQSYYARVNFGWSDKYLITATIRTDGSTRFGGNNKYGYFPSAAFKWRLSEEAFVPELFSDLSLRVGYGVTGNQQIPHNIYTDRNRYSDWTINSEGKAVNGGGLAPVAFANPDLKWESTAQTNVGVDFGLFDNKLRGSLDFYYKNTTDLLIVTISAQPAPNPFVYQNLPAHVINKGFELTLETNAMVRENFKWTIAANAAYNNNLVTDLGEKFYITGIINGQGLTGAYSQRIANNQPLYSYYVREFNGFDANGNAIYAGGDIQKFVGKSPLPKWNIGLTNNLKFKNWDLNLFFSSQLGQYVYSNSANAFFTAGSLANGRNTTKDVPTTNEGKLNAPDVSTRFLYDASFVRLQNMTLGYNMPIKNSKISSLRFSLTGQNLFVITSYPFQDPEVSVNKLGPGNLSSSPPVPSAGIDYTTYPKARTYTFGINATF